MLEPVDAAQQVYVLLISSARQHVDNLKCYKRGIETYTTRLSLPRTIITPDLSTRTAASISQYFGCDVVTLESQLRRSKGWRVRSIIAVFFRRLRYSTMGNHLKDSND